MCLMWLYHHMLSVYIYPGKAGFAVYITVQSCDVHTYSRIFWPDGRMCLFAHHTTALSALYADLSVGIELLKCSSDIFCLESESKIKSILSIVFHALYGAVRIQRTHFSYDDCVNSCTLSYCHHQISIMTHFPLLGVGHETMIYALYVFLYSYIYSTFQKYKILET